MSASARIILADPSYDPFADGAACDFAIGAFDGVHRGHAELIAGMRAHAAEHGCPCAAVLFDPDPSAVLMPEGAEDALMCIDERIDALLDLGINAVVCFGFDAELAATPYDDFIEGRLAGIAPIAALFVGQGFRLGAGGAGDVGALESLGKAWGFEVFGVPLTQAGGLPVSSSRIRSLIEAGDVAAASKLLGRPHAVMGAVVHGRGEGTGLGFPTANIVVGEGLCVPAEGVYACWADVPDGRFPAAVNVGAPRSFTAASAQGCTGTLMEAHLIGFSDELYGCTLKLSFVERIRPQESFASIADLQSAVSDNIEWVRRRLGGSEEVDDDRGRG